MLKKSIFRVFPALPILFLIVFAAPPLCAASGGGNTLAYVTSGDVWIRELTGGQSRRLTTDGENCCPRWSSSGKYLAFWKQGKAWIMDIGAGEAHPLGDVPAHQFEWAPGSDRFACVAREEELQMAEAGSLKPKVLFAASPAGRIGEIAWSPDGEWIALAYGETKSGPEGKPLYEQSIRKVSLKDAAVSDWVRFPPIREQSEGDEPPEGLVVPGNTIVAEWGPAGLLLWQGQVLSASLLADGVPLYLLSPDGSIKIVADTMLLHRSFLAASPDKKRLAVVEGAGREAWTDKRLALVDYASLKKQYLTEENVAVMFAAWSPDGGRIAYAAAPDTGSMFAGLLSSPDPKAKLTDRRIWVMKSDGSEKQQLTSDPAFRDEYPLWSADGGGMLFVRIDNAGKGSVWQVPVTGGAPTELLGELSFDPTDVDSGYYGYVDWAKYFDWYRKPDTGEMYNPYLIAGVIILLAVTLLSQRTPKTPGSKRD